VCTAPLTGRCGSAHPRSGPKHVPQTTRDVGQSRLRAVRRGSRCVLPARCKPAVLTLAWSPTVRSANLRLALTGDAQGIGLVAPDNGSADSVALNAVEQAGMITLHERQRKSVEVVKKQRWGNAHANNVRPVKW
jgi:cold shock CspA family protein